MRISFMKLNFRQSTNPSTCYRFDGQEIEMLYSRQRILKISMGDQLDDFYEKCILNDVSGHEVNYYFHTERLSPTEFMTYRNRFEANQNRLAIQIFSDNKKRKGRYRGGRKRADARRRRLDNLKSCLSERLDAKMKLSKVNDYRLYGGMRATLVFDHQSCFAESCYDRAQNYENLCRTIEPLLLTQLWTLKNAYNIPNSSKDIKIIGFEDGDIS